MNPSDAGTPFANLLEATPAQPDASLDLRGTPCPINFVRTKLQLEKNVSWGFVGGLA